MSRGYASEEIKSNQELNNPYREQWQIIKDLYYGKGKGSNVFGLECCFLILLSVILMLMPGMAIKWLVRKRGVRDRKKTIELYAISKPVFLFIILYFSLTNSFWAPLVAIVSLFDLYFYLFGMVFLRDFWERPVSAGRSVLLLGIDFIETILSFAVIYLHYGLVGVREGAEIIPVKEWYDAIYFSTITAATVGYGDLVALCPWGKLTIVWQVFCSFFFVAVILSRFVTRLSEQAEPPEQKTDSGAEGLSGGGKLKEVGKTS